MTSLRRLFCDRPSGPLPVSTQLTLSADEQHYARTVLRLGADAEVQLCDGHGETAMARLEAVTKKELAAVLLEPFARAQGLTHSLAMTVACPLPKGERADWMVEKLAELGIARWVWLVCARSVTLPKGSNKSERYLRVMRAAARQARHGRIPIIKGPVPLEEFLAQPTNGAQTFVADGGGQSPWQVPLTTSTTERRVIIGPEGGLTEDELRAAEHAGYGRVSLGPHILRMETAALAGALVLGTLAPVPSNKEPKDG